MEFVMNADKTSKSRAVACRAIGVLLLAVSSVAFFLAAKTIMFYTFSHLKMDTVLVYQKGVELALSLCGYSILGTLTLVYGVHYLFPSNLTS